MKMKKFVKFTSGVLAAVLTAGIFSACKPQKNTATIDENGKFVPGSLIELTVWETQGTDYAASPAAEGDVVAEWLKNKTNVTVKNMYGNDGGQWDAKLTKLVAGDNLPHIVHCGAYQGPAHFLKLEQLGKLWTLTPEIIQKYAPDVWNRTPAEYWEQMTVDGKILGIPYMASKEDAIYVNCSEEEEEFLRTVDANINDVTFDATQYLWIRDDILRDFYPDAMTYDEMAAMLEEKGEPLGDDMLDIPIYSTEEFIDFMYKIKEAGYTEDGKTVYPFGYYGGDDNWCALSWLGADMYGYKNHYYTSSWNCNENKIEIPIVGDLVRQAAKTQNKMIRDNVIDAESLAHTSNQYKEKVLNGIYAIAPLSIIQNAREINEELERNGKDFKFRPFITQVPAHEDFPAYKEKVLWQEAICFTNTLSENELYQVLNWVNVQYTEEYDKVRNWGPEEAGLYTLGEDGKPVYTDERFTRYFIEGDTSALPEVKDRKGLREAGGMLRIAPVAEDKWSPSVVYRRVNRQPDSISGFVFPADSIHVKNVKTFPPTQVWASIYAEIPEVITYWSARGQWENKFKLAFTAASDAEFDEKWDAAVAELNKIVNVENLENAMTEIARQYVSDEQ